MNQVQRWIIALGILAFLTIGVYPPWKGTVEIRVPKNDLEIHIGFTPLYDPPGLHSEYSYSTTPDTGLLTAVRVDREVLAIEWIVLSVFTVGLFVIAGDSKCKLSGGTAEASSNNK